MRLVNLYLSRSVNIGDAAAAVGRHLQALGWGAHRAAFYDLEGAPDAARFGDVVLLGGGGLGGPYYPWLRALRAVPAADAARFVAWGIGTNFHDVRRDGVVRRAGLTYPDWLARLADAGALVGVRDWGAPYPWVPCASCLLPQLDALRATEPTVDAVAYDHHERPPLELGLSRRTNTSSLPDALAHLASARVVVTNTYHGAYWATLLGRRVVVAGAFANRLRFLRHAPAFADDPAAWRAAADAAVAYPDALAECRAATAAFAADVAARFHL